MGALLCKHEAQVTADIGWVAGVASTNMPPESAAAGGTSPERAVPPAQDGAMQPHPVLEPPPPLPVPNGFSNTVVQIPEDGNGEAM